MIQNPCYQVPTPANGNAKLQCQAVSRHMAFCARDRHLKVPIDRGNQCSNHHNQILHIFPGKCRLFLCLGQNSFLGMCIHTLQTQLKMRRSIFEWFSFLNITSNIFSKIILLCKSMLIVITTWILLPGHVSEGSHVSSVVSTAQQSIKSSRISASHSVPLCCASTSINLVRLVRPPPDTPQLGALLHPVHVAQSAHSQFTVKIQHIHLWNLLASFQFL